MHVNFRPVDGSYHITIILRYTTSRKRQKYCLRIPKLARHINDLTRIVEFGFNRHIASF
jgi:hypothetical protein